MNSLGKLFLIVFFLRSSLASEEGNKILLFPFLSGSHMIHFTKFAHDLIRQDYNVSILMMEDSKYRKEMEDAGVHVVPYPGFTQAYVDSSTGIQQKGTSRITDFLDLMGTPITTTGKDRTWVPFIQSQNYDLLIRDFLSSQNDLANILQIPKNILIIPGVMDSWHLSLNIGAPFHSTTIGAMEEAFVPLPKDIQEPVDRSNFWMRVQSFFGKFPVYVIFSILQHRFSQSVVDEPYREMLGQAPLSDLVIVTGVEGILDKSSVPPHVKFVYPMAEAEKISHVDPLPEKFNNFINSHSKILLIAFGSVNKPSREFLRIVLDLSDNVEDYGIIISLKAFAAVEDLYKEIKEKENILASDWIPQRELLMSGKLTLFHTHGGFHSMMESLEAGVPMIVTPLTESDQQGNCKRVAQNGFGFCMGKPTLDQYLQAIQNFEEDGFFNETMAYVSRVVKQKVNDKKDMIYWVKQVLEVGTQHLVPHDTVHLNFIQLKDIDVHFAFFIMILGVLILLGYLTKKAVLFCSSKVPKMLTPW